VGFNIVEVSGNSAPGGPGQPEFVFTIDLNIGKLETTTGDFNVVNIFGNVQTATFTDNYTDTALGQLVLAPATGVFTFTIDRALAIAGGTDQLLQFSITATGAGQSDSVSVGIQIIICVARGTRIATDAGEVPVETLKPGDPVRLYDGRIELVRWIGSRRVVARELAADPALRPIRVAADAFAPGRPSRDLWLSPQHRVVIEGPMAELLFGEDLVLAPAKGLVNDHTITVDHEMEEVEYFHLLFDRHEVILTEGLATESFHPGDYTLAGLDGAARAELESLFPDLMERGFGPSVVPSLRPWEARVLASGREAKA
jgi:hypothetical protein